MGATSIQDAKVLISSTKIVDRTNGLKDLIHILKHNRGKASLENLGNRAYFALCETLFQCTVDERSSWLRSRSKSSKTAALLPLCATALRHVVISGVRTLKNSTVEAILDHIIECLPSKGGDFVKPLVEDFPKALRALLEYQPHVERLSKEYWDIAADFCIDSLSHMFSDHDVLSENSLHSIALSSGRTLNGSRDGTPQPSPREQPHKDRQATEEINRAADDFVICLQFLTQASNAPLLDKAEPILLGLVAFLRRKSSRGHSAAFAAINNVLLRVSLDFTDVTKRTIQSLLPLIKSLWADATLRDEMLMTLMHTEAHISALLSSQNEDGILQDLEALVDTIYGEYRRRQETSALQHLEEDHLCFRSVGGSQGDSHPLKTTAFSLRTENIRCEGLWATVSVIAQLSFMIDFRKRNNPAEHKHDDEMPMKRLRISNLFQEYLRHVSESRSNAKRAALQVIAFMTQEGPMNVENVRNAIEKLTPCISDENPVHSSWAMIALACVAFQQSAKSHEFVPYWTSIWQSASRAITSMSSSRAACYILDVILRLEIIPFSAISETVQIVLSSIELNGPALLTEASSSLLTTLIQERTAENPTFFNHTADRILYWLQGKWTPSLFAEREFTSLNAHHCNARDVLRLISFCLDWSFPYLKSCPYMVLGPIAQTRIHASSQQQLLRYLLLLDATPKFQNSLATRSGRESSEHRLTVLEGRALDFCCTEVEKTRQRWREWSRESSQNITSDMMRIVANLCFVASVLVAYADTANSRAIKLESSLEALLQSFAGFLSRREVDQYKVDAVLEVCLRTLPDIRQIEVWDQGVMRKTGSWGLPRQLANAMKDRALSKESFYAEDDDFMDIDNGPDSQMTSGVSNPDTDVPRHNLPAKTSANSLRSICSGYVHLIASMSDRAPDEEPGYDIPTSFVEYLVSISEQDLLSCRQFVQDLLSGPLQLRTESCQQLFERLIEGLLDPRAREYNTSEVANCMIVEILTGTIGVWSSSESHMKDLSEQAQDLYAFYVKGIEDMGIRKSVELQVAIANFLEGLIKQRPNFGQNHELPSLRTNFFRLLATGDIAVKNHVAGQLPDLFQQFTLEKHHEIFEDVHDTLPKVADWKEGLAIRLIVLSRLASRWHTLLRRCVYHIFETAGVIPQIIWHAKLCITDVANARDLQSSQALFKLFAPQIIFSWLAAEGKKRRIADLPHVAFGYSSLPDMIRDVEEEAVGQAMMFGNRDELDFLSTLLGIPMKKCLTENFAKSAAYSFLHDASKSKAKSTSSESQLREVVNQDQYPQLLNRHLPKIIGYIFLTIRDQNQVEEEKIAKALSKREAFDHTVKALAEMKSISHSNLVLPEDIEPSFSSRLFLDQVDRLCRRSGNDALKFWKPDTFTFVMRMLLDRIHPSLGSLHASTIIRKIRVLVALAGTTVYDGYPLQLTLHSLRPFLTDSHCSEDTLGIMQYLFSYGKEFLYHQLSFITGIGLSILISIRVFLGSTQESTTQETQHAAIMGKAQTFHKWFTEYLGSHSEYHFNRMPKSSHVRAFKSIIMAASQIRTEGNAVAGTAESKLLFELLDHERTHKKLLNPPSREMAFTLLCHNFQPPATERDDILGTDEQSSLYSTQVWQSCQRNNISDGFLLWAARVLGRAFSAFGENPDILSVSQPRTFQKYAGGGSRCRNSRTAIVQALSDLLLSDHRQEVGLAEAALRLIISRLSDDDYMAEFEQMLPAYMYPALALVIPEDETQRSVHHSESVDQSAYPAIKKDVTTWIRDLTVSLCRVGSRDPILGSLPAIVLGIAESAEKLFPYILHLVLYQEFEEQRSVRQSVSEACQAWFKQNDATAVPYVQILIEALLYLRSQAAPKEISRVDRDRWLEIDYLDAAKAATLCNMHKSALLFAETHATTAARISRRTSSVPPPELPIDLQLSIYKNLDEPDSFYGVDRGSSLASVLDRLDYESNGMKSLLFRGARMDSQMRQSGMVEAEESSGLMKSLVILNLNSITGSLLSNGQFRDVEGGVISTTLHAARKLGQWDIKAPEANNTQSSILFKAFQGLHYSNDAVKARKHIDQQLLAAMKTFAGIPKTAQAAKAPLRTLAALTEMDAIIASVGPEQIQEVWQRMKSRENWMAGGQLNDVQTLLSCRETLFNVLSNNTSLQDSLRTRSLTIRQLEVDALRSSSFMFRKLGALQDSLSSATYLSQIVEECRSVGLDIEAIAHNEVAAVLWDQGEAETSIRMRQRLHAKKGIASQAADISIPVLLARLGHHMAEARLGKPEEIIKEYLHPAIKELKGAREGPDAGEVFHEFALFCDKQLQNPDAMEDITRIKTLMERKLQEAREFEKQLKLEKTKQAREQLKFAVRRAMKWHDLDADEYERLRRSREDLLKQCLENYLLSLHASEQYNNDVLRVFSLWFEYSDTELANDAMKMYLSKVPSWKFAVLMNQLSSRLQAESTDFQKHLSALVFRICVEHPYHGMHQIYAGQQKLALKDEAAKSRQRAASSIAMSLESDKRARPYWQALYSSNSLYHELAMTKSDQDRMGKEIPLDKHRVAKEFLHKIPALRVPPATLSLPIRADCDYKDVPKITGFKPRMSIANGLSAPKVLTALASDGKPYKQLFKSGNDDLRQDAIMEQVFEQVSHLLRNHTATRLRDLHIRTYRVLPLSANSGLMEFVPNTIPLHSYLQPAHERYHPKDWKWDFCRKEVGNCSTDSNETRVKTWRKIAEHFSPVMRYFFLERFEDPDVWFGKRLAYTRSTAAISILGHVLGLGDRHCHNILLDEKSGEVVHIDLGVAFEAGRLLPVPEVVPFRLTRDLVDAMGYKRTEGVFRRCCEFTMETLRGERESIMTLLNVLRYDPLVTWTLNPVKAKRMQEGQDTAAQEGAGRGLNAVPALDEIVGESSKKKEEQAGEAGRALGVVEKKLSKTLSVAATVNELIQQATDERNLAVLYSGWSSYA